MNACNVSRGVLAAIRSAGVTAMLAIALIGCSGPANVSDGAGADSADEALASHVAKFEDFDVTAYRDAPPDLAGEVQHDVPEELMKSEAAVGARALRRVQGFRIQIHSSLDKASAVDTEERARSWWRNLPPEEKPVGLFPANLPVYLSYSQPYYRVRVGNFATRDEAETALVFIREEFRGAFIGIDIISVLK